MWATAGRQCVSNIIGECLSRGAVGSFFLGKMKILFLNGLNFIQMWEGNIFVEGWSRSTQACSHPVVRKMKGAGLQFRSVTSSTTQLIHSLWTHADELIRIYSLSENFHANPPDCSIHRSEQHTRLPALCACWCALLRCQTRERAVPGWGGCGADKNRQNEGLSSNRKAYATRLLLCDSHQVNRVALETICFI